MSDIITVQDLNLWYGAAQALHHVSMEIPEKSIPALIGPSGCGKSTYLKTLNRMNDLVPGCKIDGAVLFHGHNVYGDKIDVTELRSRIGMVFQKPNPFPMSIYDNIAYGPRTASGAARSWTGSWKNRSKAPPSGTRRRTSSKRAHSDSPADSSRGCASPARWPPNRRCF